MISTFFASRNRYSAFLKKIKYLVAVVFLLSTTHCDKPAYCSKYYFSDEYKDYLYFNKGSYWIYTDTTYGIIDTITLVKHDIRFQEDCSLSSQPQEYLQQEFTSSHFEATPNNFWIGMGQAEFNNYIGHPIIGWYNLYGSTTIDSIVIQGNLYKDVLLFSEDLTAFIRAKNIGIIKKDFLCPHGSDSVFHFELINYHLE